MPLRELRFCSNGTLKKCPDFINELIPKAPESQNTCVQILALPYTDHNDLGSVTKP